MAKKKRAPKKASEPKPEALSNPLLIDHPIHADLEPLVKAMAKTVGSSLSIMRCYSAMEEERDARGMPPADEWPDSPVLELKRAEHAEWAEKARDDFEKRGEEVAVSDFRESRWTTLIRDWRDCYLAWCAGVAAAKKAAKSPAVAAIMDAGELRPAHRWTAQTIIDLDKLAGTLHPFIAGGLDGLGFIRSGLPPLPADFRARCDAVHNRLAELRAIPAGADGGESAMGNSGPRGGGVPHLIVLWEGAEQSPRNIKLALTKSAYEEHGGDVQAAITAMRKDGHQIKQSTFYSHLKALDAKIPRWRERVRNSKKSRNVELGGAHRQRKKNRGK